MKLFARLKRLFVISVAIIAVSCGCCLVCACDSGNRGGEYADTFKRYDGFSVNYIDVGEGDAIFINFADGNTMLIDCGTENDRNYNSIKRYLDEYTGGTLNYLVLTHPDADHVGNAAKIIENYTVETAFVPDLLQPENFNPYYLAYEMLQEQGATIKYSVVGKNLSENDYYLVMLSPNAKGTTDSAYTGINSSEEPSPQASNNVSPIIYLEYKGVRFIFTGDAGISQEKVALNNLKMGMVNKNKVNLTDIDFLKVSHHGSDDASGDEFLQALTPKNAVISVGGDNNYSHPADATFARIRAANENCNIYLTSVCGTVSVFVDGSGKATVHTALDAA